MRLTPRFTAVVSRPDRKLCPPKVAGSKPSLAAAALTTLATLRAASRWSPTRWARLLKTRRKTAPALILAASSQASRALTGHAMSPPGNAHPAAEPLLIGFTAPYCDQRAIRCRLG